MEKLFCCFVSMSCCFGAPGAWVGAPGQGCFLPCRLTSPWPDLSSTTDLDPISLILSNFSCLPYFSPPPALPPRAGLLSDSSSLGVPPHPVFYGRNCYYSLLSVIPSPLPTPTARFPFMSSSTCLEFLSPVWCRFSRAIFVPTRPPSG